MNKVFKCLLTASAISVGLVLLPTLTSAEISSRIEGRLIKSSTHSAVYHVGLDGMRHAFPNEKVYFTWYSDFSQVETVSTIELASYRLGRNVLYRPGSRLIKVPSVTEVYAVEPYGALRNIGSENVAKELYGDDWADFVDDIDISFFFDYNIRGVLDFSGNHVAYPVGSLVRFNNITYLVDRRSDGKLLLRPTTALGFGLSSFESLPVYEFLNDVVPSSYSFGLPVFTGETHFSCVSCNRWDNGRQAWSAVINHQSDGELIKIDLPDRWNVTFFPEAGDGQLLMDAFEVDANEDRTFQASLRVKKHLKEEGESLSTFVKTQLKPMAMGLADGVLFYDGLSLYNMEEYDIVYPYESFNWSHVIERDGVFYELIFSNSFTYFGSYADIFDLMMKSFEVHEPVVEEVVEEVAE